MNKKWIGSFLVLVSISIIYHLLTINSIYSQDAFTFLFVDDFSKYPDGSDGSPNWLATSVGWEMKKGVFINEEGDKSFATVNTSPFGKLQTVEVTLVLQEKTDIGWKIAGIVVYKDEKYYWHLALVEKPDDMDRGHFVELIEMYEGNWLAQYQPQTKLTATVEKGTDFNWEYNHPYKLRIELTPEGIMGFVKELDGTERTKIGFKFDSKKAVTYGKPGLDNGGFKTEFDNFSCKVGMEVKEEKMAEEKKVYPPYESKGWTGIKGKPTGFFHVEEINGIWWVIDPAGNAYYIVGTDHANYNVHWCEKLGYAPYHKNVKKIYGSEEKWAESTVNRLLSWGFNSLGVNSSPSARYKGLAYMECLGMGSSFAGTDYITPKTTWTGFPNVFSPKFEKFCDKMAQRLCAPNKEDPWLIGYFIDNELEWHQWTGGGIFNDSFNKPADHSAKKAVVDFLKSRYSDDVKAFNKVWGTNISKFEDLLEFTNAPVANTPQIQKDVNEYIRLVAEKYFSITTSAIRKHDPNHMILGCRFAGGAPEIWDIAGKYCDIVSVNCYRTVDLEKGVLADGFENDIAQWYSKAKRPMMITEWSFPALDAGLPCKAGAGQRVPTQKDKAFCFTVFQKLLFSTPFMVGSDYFMWADQPELGVSKTFPEDSNYGLVNVNDEPYLLLTQAATNLHPLVYDIHSKNVPELYTKEGKDRGTFIVGNSGKENASCSVFLWADGKLIEQKKLELGGEKSQEIKVSPELISKPGGHLLVCEAQPENSFLEMDRENNLATQIFYVPGLPWCEKFKKSESLRIPIIVANSTLSILKDIPISFKLKEVLFSINWSKVKRNMCILQDINGRQAVIPFQFVSVEGSEEIVVLFDKFDSRDCKTLFLYVNVPIESQPKAKLEYHPEGEGFEIDNGVIKLIKRDLANGNAFDRIELNGIELGRFIPLMWQKVGQNMWVAPNRVKKIEVNHGATSLILDITFSFEGTPSEMKTEVDKEGKYAKMQNRPHNFWTKYRFTIYPKRPYFISQFLWVENADEEPWELGAYYHYLPSNINGNASDDEPKGKYWFDPGANISFGIEAFSPLIKIVFWKDPAGGEHPDAWRELNQMLKPGERYIEPQTQVYVVGAKDEKNWREVTEEIKSLSNLLFQVFDIEKY